MSSERLHHPYSPSKLQYLEANPCWTGEESKNTEASERGTAQHDAAEDHIDIDNPSLEDHEAEAVRLCKEFRDSVIAQYPGCMVIKEEYLPVDDEKISDSQGNVFQGTTGGYLDCGIVSADRKTAEILDWKFGKWPVEPAENNLQGIAYLLGLVKKFPDLETVTVHFVLPHRGERDSHTFTRDQFPALLLRVKTVVQRAILAQENAAKGDFSACAVRVSSCLFCGNKARCPLLHAFALKVGRKYAPAQVPENVSPSLFSDPKDAKLALEVAMLLAGWAASVRSALTHRAIENEEWLPEGYKLVSREEKEVKDWRKVLAIARTFGVGPAAIREALTVRMTPLNKAVSAAAPRGFKEQSKDDFTNRLLAEGALEKGAPTVFLQRLKE